MVVSSAEAVAQVMKTNDAACFNRRTTGLQDIIGFGGQGVIFAAYGDHWRQMRKVCVMELLSPKQVRRMEGIRTEKVGDLVRSIASSAGTATINISKKVAALSNDIVTRAVFCGKFVRQEESLRLVDEIMDLMGGLPRRPLPVIVAGSAGDSFIILLAQMPVRCNGRQKPHFTNAMAHVKDMMT
uniref:Putative Cytochrome P450 71D11 n=1 Tax=Aegilops tauschii TaxID=37682 RepID=R7W7K5_AEGTA